MIDLLPVFDGFPYLVTRVVPSLYHVTVLPDQLTEPELVDLAVQQVLANRLESSLVLGADDGDQEDTPRGVTADGAVRGQDPERYRHHVDLPTGTLRSIYRQAGLDWSLRNR